jgi:hypothetical protein
MMRSFPFVLASFCLLSLLSLTVLSQPTDAQLRVPSAATPSAAAFDVDLNFTQYLGGTLQESHPMVRADRAGNVLVCGMTVSADFPQIPPGQSYPAKVTSIFVTKYDGSDGSIIFSRRIGRGFNLLDAAVGEHDDLILLVQAVGNFDSLLTWNAQWKSRSQYGFLVLDSTGALRYASYIRTDGLQEIVDMETDSNGDIYILAHTYTTPPMVTPDAMFPVNQGSEDGFIMKFSADEYRLSYATCFGGTGHEEYTHIAADGCSIAFAGVSWDNGGYPLVNPVQSAPSGQMDFIVSRISADGQTIIFSTFLGGKGSEGWASDGTFYRRLRFDQEGNLYFVGETASVDFPVTDILASFKRGAYDIAVCKFAPTGDLLFSTVLGGSGTDRPGEIDVDGCGNVILSGYSYGTDLVLRDPIMTNGTAFLSVIDTETPELLFNTRTANFVGIPTGGSSVLSDSTVFLTGASDPTTGMPATPGFPAPHPIGNDVLVSSITMPDLCSRIALSDYLWTVPEISIDLQPSIDTLKIDTRRGVVMPSHFPIEVKLRNLSPNLVSSAVMVRLRLPSGVEIAPGSPPADFDLGILQPGEERTVTWIVHPAVTVSAPQQLLSILVSAHQQGACPNQSALRMNIPVVYRDLAYAELACDLALRDSIALSADRTRFLSDTVTVALRLTNLLDSPAPLHAVRLNISGNTGLTFLDPPDPLVFIPSIPPLGVSDITWTLRVRAQQFDRAVRFNAVVIDTFGYPMQQCETVTFIPGASGSICSVTAPSTVSCLGDGTSDPSPIPVMLTVENPLDTTRFYSTLHLDLSSAPHLRIAAGDSLTRDRFYIREKFRRLFDWRLELKPGLDATVSETVRMRYMTESDSAMQTCEQVIELKFRSAELDCGIIAPDYLTVDAGSGALVGDTISIEAVVWNSGEVELSPVEARLSVPPEHGCTIFGNIARPLSTLQPGERDTVGWLAHVPGFLHAREIPFSVTVYGEDAAPATGCMHMLRVPAVEPVCRVELPDTIYYDSVTRTYMPEEFELVATLTNPSDSALGLVRAEVDTSGLSRVRLLSPVSTERADLNMHATWEVRWIFEPRWADHTEVMEIPVRFMIVAHGRVFTCSRSIRIEGASADIELQCESAGHDSVWADVFHEKLIPNPVQLQYTLRNTGITIATGCTIAILPPPMMDLVPGQDSIRAVPDLLPGERFSAEWMLAIAEDRITPGPWTVRWESACGDSAVPMNCDIRIGLSQDAPAGVVVSPWLLRFEAEKDGPLPSSRSVDLWTGGGTEPRWSVVSTPLWLDVAPLSGGGHVEMNAGPNTTGLSIGTHRDAITLSDVPLRTGGIHVIYRIHSVLDAGEESAPRPIVIGRLYPHPVRTGSRCVVDFTSPSSSAVSVRVHDMLGRVMYEHAYTAFEAAAGKITIPTSEFHPGIHLLTLRTGDVSASRLFVVQP